MITIISPFLLKQKIFVVLVSVLVFSSCSPVYYPDRINSPMLTGRKELQLSGSTGTAGYEAQTAYAITNNIGIIAGGAYKDKGESNGNHKKHAAGEIGIGYFNRTENNLLLESFLGYGMGYGDTKYSYTWFGNHTTKGYGNYNKFFIQGGLGFSQGTFYEGGFSAKGVMVNMFQYDGKNDTMTVSSPTVNGLFLETALTTKIGWENVKFLFQIGASLPITRNYRNNFDSQNLMFSAGIQLALFRKKE